MVHLVNPAQFSLKYLTSAVPSSPFLPRLLPEWPLPQCPGLAASCSPVTVTSEVPRGLSPARGFGLSPGRGAPKT